MDNLAYKEEVRTELLNGEIIAMSPRPSVNHNNAMLNISHIFRNYLRGKKCKAFTELDVHLTENDIVAPDVIIVCDRDIIRKDGIHGVPDLIVEILSPSTARYDKGYKKNLYEICGVKEYWIVSTESYSVDVYLLKENRLLFDNAYSIYPDYLISKMTDAEKDKIVNEFTTSLYHDMKIKLADVFYDVT